MKKIVVLFYLLWIMLFVYGCTSKEEETSKQNQEASQVLEKSGETTMPQVTPGFDFFAQAAKPYRGSIIRGISDNTPPTQYARTVLAPSFEKLTGIKVVYEVAQWGSYWDMVLKDMESKSGIYDFIHIEDELIYESIERGFLVNLTEMLEKYPNLASPDFKIANFTKIINSFIDPTTKDLFGIPIDSFIKVYIYRKDLFKDPVIRASFAKEYGYPLTPAITVRQYRNIAIFFTMYGKKNGLELWGTTVQAGTDSRALFYEFASDILPAFGVYNWGINVDNHRATAAHGGRLNSERAKQALSFWVGMLEYAPPESIDKDTDWDAVAKIFAAGRAAQAWTYGENVSWIATDTTRSKVAGKVGAALNPTYPGVMEEASGGKGYIGYYDGAAYAMSQFAKNKEATLLWLQYLGLPSIQPQWAAAAGRVVHWATFDDPLVIAQDKKAGGYYSVMKKYQHLYGGAPPFAFNMHIADTLYPFLGQAVRGELTPAEALDQGAAAVDDKLVRLGYVK